MFLIRLIFYFFFFFLFLVIVIKVKKKWKSCGQKLKQDNEIIERSGTKFNSAIDMDLAMRDAETRLQSGGGLLGKGGFHLMVF